MPRVSQTSGQLTFTLPVAVVGSPLPSLGFYAEDLLLRDFKKSSGGAYGT